MFCIVRLVFCSIVRVTWRVYLVQSFCFPALVSSRHLTLVLLCVCL